MLWMIEKAKTFDTTPPCRSPTAVYYALYPIEPRNRFCPCWFVIFNVGLKNHALLLILSSGWCSQWLYIPETIFTTNFNETIHKYFKSSQPTDWSLVYECQNVSEEIFLLICFSFSAIMPCFSKDVSGLTRLVVLQNCYRQVISLGLYSVILWA